MKIILDPRFQINYATYYIYGIEHLYGKKNVSFKPLHGIDVLDHSDYMKGVACLAIKDTSIQKKIFIDTADTNSIHERYYLWCDLYAKINVCQDDLFREKLLVIGPSFGIRLWSPLETLWRGWKNFRMSIECIGYLPTPKEYFLNYAYTFVRRTRLSRYGRLYSENKEYVFACNTLWYDDLTYNTTNRFRGSFVRICKKIFSQFEGGFYYIPSQGVEAQFPKYKDYLVEYKDILIHRRVGMKEYLKKLRKSALVFNVPSVSGCHGWKLGEYLALGKVIVSMPLNNAIPEGWIDGITHVEVHNEVEMEQVIKRLHEDPELCSRLKQGASNYYDQKLAPQKVIGSLFQTLFAGETDGNRSHL